ncbi:MAG: PhoH family protein [Candidatus Omnitrophica bacterium]|nr:PhoH family protein [Candidatus Omnitrophota bacterium]
MHEKTIHIRDDAEARQLFGKHDEILKKIEKAYGITTSFRNGDLKIMAENGPALDEAEKVLGGFLEVIRNGGHFSARDMDYAVKNVELREGFHDIYLDRIKVYSERVHITPRSEGQKKYIDAIRKNDIVFSIGPAGTGKTYLAMAMAVNALKKGLVSRIILTRPAVEAGENLGFLPGDIFAKVSPYLRPLYDALLDMADPRMVKDFIDRGIVEVAPLAFMRGRTLNDSFIIMDEAQNSTPEQMQMFLTRLGFDSKTVITGDVTQSDLPKGKESGLLHARSLLEGIEGIVFVAMSGSDVVRHRLVQKIIEAYHRGAEKTK